jgi:glycine cleavage system aminomethyltransferase T
MPNDSLESKLQRAGNAVQMLRNSPVGVFDMPFRPQYSNWRDEQEAWCTTAVLFDQSFHMTDIYFKGPDVQRLLSDHGVNGFGTFGKNKAKQLVVCNPDGHVIGDAILFGLADDEVSIVGRPSAPNWVAFRAETGGYDVEVTRDERSAVNRGQRLIFRYQLQGPNAQKIVEKAHGGPIPTIKFFNIGEFTIAGVPIRALNHTMSGIPGEELTGLEMTGPADARDAVMEALLDAGAEYGLRQGGARAYPSTLLESGWIPSPTPAIYSGDAMQPYREWLTATSWEANASLGGSFVSAEIEDYYQTPWDLGYGSLIKFDHDFVGRSALEQLADQPHRQKVWLRWNDEDVTNVFARSVFGTDDRAKYLEAPLSIYCTLPFDTVLSGDRPVGLSTFNGYTVNLRSWVSLAMIDEADARDGAEVTVVWGEPGGGTSKPTVERHVQTNVRATIHTTPLV